MPLKRGRRRNGKTTRLLHKPKDPLLPRSSREQTPRKSVIPAKAGIHFNHESLWIPACAGMTKRAGRPRSQERPIGGRIPVVTPLRARVRGTAMSPTASSHQHAAPGGRLRDRESETGGSAPSGRPSGKAGALLDALPDAFPARHDADHLDPGPGLGGHRLLDPFQVFVEYLLDFVAASLRPRAFEGFRLSRPRELEFELAEPARFQLVERRHRAVQLVVDPLLEGVPAADDPLAGLGHRLRQPALEPVEVRR